MDTMLTAVFNLLLSQGLSGVVIAMLGYVCYALYTKNERLQDQRVEELRIVLTALGANTTAMNNNTMAMTKVVDGVERITDTVRSCPK